MSNAEPYTRWKSITASDTEDLEEIPQAIYVGSTGTIKMTDLSGNTEKLTAVPVGVLRVRPKRIYSTDTSASLIMGLYGE
jgi:hypothetical protein